MLNGNIDKITPVFMLKIQSVGEVIDGNCIITLEAGQEVTDPIVVSSDFIDKHNPEPGGYYIMCQCGHGFYSK